jgi:hypothetical protein
MPRKTSSSAHGSARWARRCLAIVVTLTVIVTGCGPADVTFTFDNRTDTAFCEYASHQSAQSARCLAELKPHDDTHWGRDCDNQSDRPIRVVITVKQGGRQIYDRTATCGEWHDADGKFVIEQQGDDFIVTDSLPDRP